MSSKLAKSLWKYKGEAADYAYYRTQDKVTPDEEVRQKLELLHSWYPNQTFAQMQGKDVEIRNRFLSFFPKADMNQLELRSHPDSGINIFFGAWAIFGDTPTDESKLSDPKVIKALGLSGSFPPKLIQTGANYPLPAKKGEKIATDIEIYSSPTNSFMIEFRDVFKEQVVKFTSAKECGVWAEGPNFKYWPQQLNLAVWCATGGCGVSTDFSGLPNMIRSSLQFHIYFTTRRLLWEMKAALPGDSSFNVVTNPYSKVGVERICNEFGLHSPDFRWKRGDNSGLGSVFSYWNVMGKRSLIKMGHDSMHSRYSKWPGGNSKFSDEATADPKIKKDGFFGMFKEYDGDDSNLIAFIRNDDSSDQANWYVLSNSFGLTRAGVGRLNRSIEAFVYCVLGAQVNMRGSIVGDGGIAQNVRQELTDLFEKAIIEESLSESVRRYQEAIQNSGVKLDFAISPGAWLLPSKLEINLEHKVGYNNFLQKANENMRLGVNSRVNMPKHVETKPDVSKPVTKSPDVPKPKPETSSKVVESHNDTLAAVAVTVAGVGWWWFR